MDRGDMVDWLTKDDDLVLQYFNNPTELAAEILVTWDDDWTHGHPAREKLCG
ncbi:MAG: hypothetical protein JAZ17_17440 [Candidatus Thiodiazotropha endolucinida]|nr:hypothetical protein [Candidatus Thiodiazotropha taylori]MCG8095374.1 hypothetical protein [Candidatus Thiodiazotropha endolucinida]MCW4268776.1 hypothetical protein [Candidatus Thiodiazotropha endolucinida]